jgi:hypothetical protein
MVGILKVKEENSRTRSRIHSSGSIDPQRSGQFAGQKSLGPLGNPFEIADLFLPA